MKKYILSFLIFLFAVCAWCGQFTMSVLDVGQGLCIVCISPDSHCLVFDCGTGDSKNQKSNMNISDRTLMPYLKEKNIKKIDYLILSHPNTDHYSGFTHLAEKYPIGKYIKNGYKSDTFTYNELMKSLAKKKLSATTARKGNRYNLGKEVVCTVVSPVNNVEEKNDNDNSVMVKIQYRNTSFLLTGDASAKCEKKAVRYNRKFLRSDVLVASHHGSKYSSCYEFLNTVRPQATIISCGKNNRYGHPHKETLDRVAKSGSRIYRTDLDGAVVCTSDGKKITISKTRKK